MDSRSRYLEWLHADAVDAETKAELSAIENDPAEIEERFYQSLEFGTAGLRGIIGAGTNRMNKYVVRQASQGLADYVASFPDGRTRGVCIAYDSRQYSEAFAAETACVLAANGIRAFLFSTLHSVPQLSFALQRHGCIAGVVITASHNPKKYNGYKVYWAYGGQASPEVSAAIYDNIQNTPLFSVRPADFAQALASGMITMLGAEDDEAYYEMAESYLLCPALLSEKGASVQIVYTPLHGSGNVPVNALLARIGVTNVLTVPEQREPDSAFPTVAAPNPEDPTAFALAIALAEKTGASVCLATDPDADRLGVSVKTSDGTWITLTGNQIGSLLLAHVLSERKRQGTLPANGVAIKSFVSTRLADAIAASYGVAMEDVLTGFRFIAERIDAYARTGEKTFLFGFEESYGFLADKAVRDKDAICSAALVAELCVLENEHGRTLYDALKRLYETHGYFKESVKSYTLEGKAGIMRIRAAMAQLRATPPARFAGDEVLVHEDFLAGTRHTKAGDTDIGLPPSDALRYTLESGAWIAVRPSGTEPKLKLYIGANAKDEGTLDRTLDLLRGDVDALLQKLLHAE